MKKNSASRAIGALLIASLALPASVPAQVPETSVEAQLPAVDGEKKMAPLTQDQLGPEEKAAFAKLEPGTAAASRFLHTRGFLRYAKLVVDKKLDVKQLPDLPADANWDRAYLSPAEGKIVDQALMLSMASLFKPFTQLPALAATAELPAINAQGVMAPLEPKQLDPTERERFEALAAGSPEATKFLYTRGFLRYAKLLVDGKIEPLRLPALPAREHWDRAYFTEHEAKNIVDVALAMNLVAMMKPPE